MPTGEGLTSEPLRAALRDALAGRPAALETFFTRHGGGPDARPNLRLAAAFGDELAGDVDARAATRLLRRFSAEDAAPDTSPVFLPMAAAHGWVGLLRARREVDEAWAALLELAGDERAPVRVATHAALRAYALLDGRAGELVGRADAWLEADDPEVGYGAASVVVEVLGEHQSLASSRVLPAALSYLGRAVALAADAPRSAERSDGRRRLLRGAAPRARDRGRGGRRGRRRVARGPVRGGDPARRPRDALRRRRSRAGRESRAWDPPPQGPRGQRQAAARPDAHSPRRRPRQGLAQNKIVRDPARVPRPRALAPGGEAALRSGANERRP